MASDGKKGITVKVDSALHAEITQYLQDHGMTMTEFVTLALQDELHPKIDEKEGKNMEKMRTLAFQVPESLFQRIKDYLHRNNMTQKDFVIGLIEQALAEADEEFEAAEAAAAEDMMDEAEEANQESEVDSDADVDEDAEPDDAPEGNAEANAALAGSTVENAGYDGPAFDADAERAV